MSEEAIVVLQREINWLDHYEGQLDRQLEVFPPDSKDAHGARQAKDVCKGRIKALQAAISVLQRHDHPSGLPGMRP